jgi:hypothetical protein
VQILQSLLNAHLAAKLIFAALPAAPELVHKLTVPEAQFDLLAGALDIGLPCSCSIALDTL